MVEFIIRSGNNVGKRLRLPDKDVSLTIGRDEDCQLRLNSSLISRRHCKVHIAGQVVSVEDLESQNGTYVNDVAVKGTLVLHPGDFLRVGASVFELVGKEATPAPSTKSASSPVVRPSPKNKVSDADINSWLAEDDKPAKSPGALSSDTTILPKVPVAPPTVAKAPEKPAAAVPAANRTGTESSKAVSGASTPTATEYVLKPPNPAVVKRAGEIIRQHWLKRKNKS